MREARSPSSPGRRGDLLSRTRRRLHEAGKDLPGLEARILVCHVCRCSPETLVARDELPVSPEEARALEELLERRLGGEPMAYLVGEREFWGRSFHVDPRVLVPRPETEHLVEAVFDALPRRGADLDLLDLGTGSGILAITLSLDGAFRQVLGSDVSPEALAVARENARRLDAPVLFRQGDLFAALAPGERMDVIVSNPPYVDPLALETLDLDHEPRLALDGGAGGGTRILDRLVDGLEEHLAPGGMAFFEIGADQGDWARERARIHPDLELVEIRRDLAGHDRVVVFRRDEGKEASAP